MSNYAVIQVSISVIEQMKHHYNAYLAPKVPPGGVFSAKIASCTITAYKSGKVLFQGTGAVQEAARWGQQAPATAKSTVPKKKAVTIYTPPDEIGAMSAIGSDEVGTGDYFGPMIVAAAYVEKTQLPLLKELGVRDSKTLTDEQIAALAKQLISFLPYSLLTLHNEKYNELQGKGLNQGELKARMHNQAINKVLERLQPHKPEAIVIDQFVQPDTYYKYLAKQKNVQRENVYFSTKGESVHLAVAAASIIARYAFVKQFAELSKQAGFILPKGAGAQVDAAAAKIIKKYGEGCLKTYAKLHFANTEKAKQLANK
ncbi:MAG: ribonuclease HIII [Ectobacillus sp.]